MRRVILIISILSIVTFHLRGAYPTDSIDSRLYENADAIIREFTTDFKVLDAENASLHVYFAVTILNKNGEKHGVFSEIHHNFKKVSDVQGSVYDKNGNLLKEFSRSDIQDVGALSDFTLYQDNRLKYCRPVADFYPYTVVYEYDIFYNGLFYYPTWFAVPDFNVSAEDAVFTLEIPSDVKFNFKPLNIQTEPVIIKKNSKDYYSWKLSNVGAITEEPLSPHLSALTPSIYLAPQRFEINGYEGVMDSWRDFGMWVNKLNNGRDELTNDNAIKAVKEIKNSSNDTLEVVKRIYEYMQSRTRYVSIKLGIGGYQPFHADLVHEVGYGDCKALTIYTKALLKQAGIKSHYTLIRSGEEAPEILVDFPSPQFNHSILCVPLKNDTIWLECTHQHLPFGYISEFSHNRHVLLVTEDGGRIARTPQYNEKSNVQIQVGNVKINAQGDARIQVSSSMSGLQYDLVLEPIYATHQIQKNWIYENFNMPTFHLVDFTFQEERDMIPVAYLNMDIEIDGFATRSNKRMFLPVNPLNKIQNVPTGNKERHSDILIRYPYTDFDTLIVQLPSENFSTEYWPDDVELENEFGYYKTTYMYDEEQKVITYTRHLLINDGKFDRSKYPALVSFLELIKTQDNTKIVFVKEQVN